MTNFMIYNRVANNDPEDPEASRDQSARILAFIEAYGVEACGWVNVAEHIDGTQGGAK